MRSPVIAFSLLAAAVSPTLVSGAPASPKLDNAIAHTEAAATQAHQIRAVPAGPPSALGDVPISIPGFPSASAPATPSAPSGNPVDRTKAMKAAKQQANQQDAPVKAPAMPAVAAKKGKRAGDNGTAGGNAYSGAASDSSGGDVVNEADRGEVTNADGSSQYILPSSFTIAIANTRDTRRCWWCWLFVQRLRFRRQRPGSRSWW
ncbi:hypothetical protein GY45DRAFT_578591 [Cubamyces sp. BRFM 1775]|nr:hypothetical protein GY45DRAFT_578591 [Cubamyces sp. BRFM 1775]